MMEVCGINVNLNEYLIKKTGNIKIKDGKFYPIIQMEEKRRGIL